MFSSLFDQILAVPTQVSDPPLGDTGEKEPFYIIASMLPLMFAQCPSRVLMFSPVFLSYPGSSFRCGSMRSIHSDTQCSDHGSGCHMEVSALEYVSSSKRV